MLVMENITCFFLPDNMDSHFPNLNHLDVTNTGLKIITKDNMKMFPHLKYLYIRKNLIENLPPDLFECNKELQFINLSENKIKIVDEKTFDSLPNLISVNMEGNVCIDKSVYNDIVSLKTEIILKCQ